MEEERRNCQDDSTAGEEGRTGGGSSGIDTSTGTSDGGNKKTEAETKKEASEDEENADNGGSQCDGNGIDKNAKEDGSCINDGGGGSSTSEQSSPGDQNEQNDDDHTDNYDNSVKNEKKEEAREGEGSQRKCNKGDEGECDDHEDVEKQASSSSISLIDEIRRSNWQGCIPVIVELAPTSNSSTSKPPPIHVLLNRHTFLHVGLEDAVRKLHDYAPPTFTGGGGGVGGVDKRVVVVEEPESTLDLDMDMENGGRNTNWDDEKNNSNFEYNDESSDTDTTSDSHKTKKKRKKKKPISPYPRCWFEDQETGTPLKWQYFVGVLFDSIVQPSSFLGTGNEITTTTTTTPVLPWKIRLHFISYPATLLELDEGGTTRSDTVSTNNHDLLLTTIERTFFNSLKQSLVLQHGHAKVALNMTKQSHNSIWEAVCTSNYDKYRPVGNDIQVKQSVNIVASSQKRKNNPPLSSSPSETTATKPATTDTSSTSRDPDTSTESMPMPTPKSVSSMKSMTIPVRLSVDPTQPMIQKRCDYDPNNNNDNQKQRNPTLGSLLSEWAPQYFVRQNEDIVSPASQQNNDDVSQDDDIGDGGEAGVGEVVNARDPMSVSWRVAGVTPPLSTPLIDLWTTLSHPDQFLYISVVKRSATNRY